VAAIAAIGDDADQGRAGLGLDLGQDRRQRELRQRVAQVDDL
jgi:hypothetical protein